MCSFWSDPHFDISWCFAWIEWQFWWCISSLLCNQEVFKQCGLRLGTVCIPAKKCDHLKKKCILNIGLKKKKFIKNRWCCSVLFVYDIWEAETMEKQSRIHKVVCHWQNFCLLKKNFKKKEFVGNFLHLRTWSVVANWKVFVQNLKQRPFEMTNFCLFDLPRLLGLGPDTLKLRRFIFFTLWPRYEILTTINLKVLRLNFVVCPQFQTLDHLSNITVFAKQIDRL